MNKFDPIDYIEVQLVARQMSVNHLSGRAVLNVVNEILRRRAYEEVDQVLLAQRMERERLTKIRREFEEARGK